MCIKATTGAGMFQKTLKYRYIVHFQAYILSQTLAGKIITSNFYDIRVKDREKVAQET